MNYRIFIAVLVSLFVLSSIPLVAKAESKGVDCPIPSKGGFHSAPIYNYQSFREEGWFFDKTNGKVYNLKNTTRSENSLKGDLVSVELFEYDVFNKCQTANTLHLNTIAQSYESKDVEIIASFFVQASRQIWFLGHRHLGFVDLNKPLSHPNRIVSFPDFVVNSVIGKELSSSQLYAFNDGNNAYILGAGEGTYPVVEASKKIYKLKLSATPSLSLLSAKLPTKVKFLMNPNAWDPYRRKYYMFGLDGHDTNPSFPYVWSFSPDTQKIESYPQHLMARAPNTFTAPAVFSPKDNMIYLFSPQHNSWAGGARNWVLRYSPETGFVPTGHHLKHSNLKGGHAVYDAWRKIILVTPARKSDTPMSETPLALITQDDFIIYVPEPSPPVCQCHSCASCTQKLNDPNCTLVNVTGPLSSSGICIDNPEAFNHKILNCQGNTIDAEVGIALTKSHGAAITNCKFTMNNYKYAMKLLNTTRTRIENCEFIGNNYGVTTYDKDQWWYKDTRTFSLNNCTFDGPQRGMELYAAEYSSLTNNIFYNTGYAIQLLNNKDLTVYNNILYKGSIALSMIYGDARLLENMIASNVVGVRITDWTSQDINLHSNHICYNSSWDVDLMAGLNIISSANNCDKTSNYACEYACP